MRVCAIICEYNPFHNGHAHLISKAKQMGFTHIVAIMSGNFTQRGELSIVSKLAKTKMALLNNVDLVIELPAVYSISRAETFAKSAIYLANSLGCIDALIFGSECGNIEILKTAAEATSFKTVNTEIKKFLKTGITFAKARALAIEKVYGSRVSNIFNFSNNNLAIEYIKALNDFDSRIKPLPVLREQVLHDSMDFAGNFASASYIRSLILKGQDYSQFVPRATLEILKQEMALGLAPADVKRLERAFLFQLRKLEIDDILMASEIGEGLEFKIYKEIKSSSSFEELLDKVKSKRYTLARIKRIVLSLILGIDKEFQNVLPSYIRILGFSAKGKEFLSKLKKSATLPVFTKYSEVEKYKDENILKKFAFEAKLSDIYSLALPKVCEMGLDYKFSVVDGDKII